MKAPPNPGFQRELDQQTSLGHGEEGTTQLVTVVENGNACTWQTYADALGGKGQDGRNLFLKQAGGVRVCRENGSRASTFCFAYFYSI